MTDDIKFYKKQLLRRLPLLTAVLLLCSIIGVVIAIRLPTLYETSATLLVESAQIPDDMVRSSVDVDPTEQLEVVQRRLMTRTNLLDVARRSNVFPDIAQMSPDEIVEAMKERTTITRSNKRDSATVMTIGFEDADPNTVAAVVNQYVTIVLATNSDFRTTRAQGTLDFFQQEAQRLSEDLDLQNQKILDFKNQNADALPENINFRLNQQSLLQERLARDQREIDTLVAQRSSVQRLFESSGQLPADANLTPEQKQLQDLENQLRTALSVYSEENPKVRILRTRIEALRRIVASGDRPASAGEEDGPATPLDINLAEIDAKIAALRDEVASTQGKLDALQTIIDRAPTVQISLEAMQRDRDNIQQLYAAAVQQLSQAQMGERIEVSAKGQRITVIEPANVPTDPSSPNRLKIAGMGIGAGLALAAGLFMLLEFLNQSVRRPEDIVAALDITPLATLPLMETAAHRRWRRAAQLATLAIVIVSVPATLWAVDTYYMPLDLLYEKLMERII